MKQHTYILFHLCLLLGGQLAAQNPHPYFRNYNTDQGLPSSEVHYALQDDDGYMWLATDNGLSRFDGYTFKNYGKREGLKDNVVFYLQKAPDGKIWLATMSNALYFVEGDSIVAYAQNEMIIDYTEGELISDFYIDTLATLYLSVNHKGILQIDKKGHSVSLQNEQPLGGPLVREAVGGKILCSYNTVDSLRQLKYELYDNKGISPPLEWQTKETNFVLNGLPFAAHNSGSNLGIIRIDEHTYLLYFRYYLFKVQGNHFVWKKYIAYSFRIKSTFITESGQILLGLQGGAGLRRYKNLDDLKNDIYEQYLPGKSITHIFQDKQGAYWISTLEHGVFYCPDFDQKIYDRSFGFPNEDVRCLTFKNDHELYIGFRTGELILLDRYTSSAKNTEMLARQDKKIIYDLYFDKNENRLWLSSGRIKYWDTNQWKRLYFNDPLIITKSVSVKRFTSNKKDNTLWYANIYGFGSVDMNKKQFIDNSLYVNIIERAFIVMKTVKGQVWVGNARGLFEYKNKHLIPPSPFYDAFNTRVDDIAERQDGTLVLATKGEGVLLWKDSSFQQFTIDDGLLSNMIENVHVDEQDRIWIGTLQGLNRITFSENDSLTRPKVERFTIWHGLPSNEINQVRSEGDQVWIATTRGLMKWKEPQKSTSTKPPILRTLLVNKQKIDLAKDATFAYNKNDFSFQFVAINYHLNGDILYRYRINKESWSTTKQTTINFARLSPAVYTFAVQSQNEYGVWSDSATYAFCIHAPWWQQWWFYGLSLLGLVLIGVRIYKYRMRVFKKEYELKDKVIELEKKALQAQMNPHFIFNCLTSIQRLVMDKETDNAIRYLGRFSKLVRATLNASVQGEISLEEEIEMLESYLQLEKLRFKSAFEYEIIVDPSLDIFDTTFPSMLLQPYVENAIVHGMQGKEKDGKIAIHFQNQNGSLVATISDNGGGMRATSKLNPLHKSVGMSITSHRLQLLHDGEEKKFVQVSDVLGKNNEVIGINIRVVLKNHLIFVKTLDNTS